MRGKESPLLWIACEVLFALVTRLCVTEDRAVISRLAGWVPGEPGATVNLGFSALQPEKPSKGNMTKTCENLYLQKYSLHWYLQRGGGRGGEARSREQLKYTATVSSSTFQCTFPQWPK